LHLKMLTTLDPCGPQNIMITSDLSGHTQMVSVVYSNKIWLTQLLAYSLFDYTLIIIIMIFIPP